MCVHVAWCDVWMLRMHLYLVDLHADGARGGEHPEAVCGCMYVCVC